MTTTTKSTMEKAIVGTMWAILLAYIGWSSLRIMGNSMTLAVIEERSNAILARMDKVEMLRDSIDASKTACMSRHKILTSEIEGLKRHVAGDNAWSLRIEERLDDLRKRVDSLPPHELTERIKELEKWRLEQK